MSTLNGVENSENKQKIEEIKTEAMPNENNIQVILILFILFFFIFILLG